MPNHTFLISPFSDLYYKHFTIVNYDSSIVNRFGASFTDDARGVIYDRHMFVVQATEGDHLHDMVEPKYWAFLQQTVNKNWP